VEERFDAFVVAGYNPDSPDPLAQATGVSHKALLPIGGAPMIWHVVRALEESGRIREIVVVGLEDAEAAAIDFGRPVHVVPNRRSLIENQYAGLCRLRELDPADRVVLALSGDVPLLTGEIVAHFLDRCRPFDKGLYWGIVERRTVEAVFPHSQRSYIKLRDGHFCNGDIYCGWLSVGFQIQEAGRYILAHRKNQLRQLWLLGPWVLLRYLFRRLSTTDLIAVAERVLGVQGMPIILPYAEAAMDVDRPRHLELVHRYLETHPEHPIHHRALSPQQP